MEDRANQPELSREFLLKLMKICIFLKEFNQAEQDRGPDNFSKYGGKDEHLNTIPRKQKKSSVENLVPILNSSITSPKIDFLPEEFVGELDFIDTITRIDEDNFNEDDFIEEKKGENDYGYSSK
ncbi:hypothetical protein Tco_0458417 [Tanacetum coccineum]